ncbi:uncharacterized protein E5676_scaffold263G00040 [Cucumis melo var. makuwa]|uniref:Uncharacterized protein n=1 Tax=Cucumis melo var. makuwa TaxID=1194695 RepID=A0A5D3CJU4_CUCMM|nr:uncharacterized protein E6C27_scaffold19G00530 [Cucumis melo var. makuwa]TYK11572.1 uncharacterized protein E5676_scaffold263G00040 [Cucumis melo var. makuwa]
MSTNLLLPISSLLPKLRCPVGLKSISEDFFLRSLAPLKCNNNFNNVYSTAMADNRQFWLKINLTKEEIQNHAAWTKSDFICKNLILNELSDELDDYYSTMFTAKEVWDALQKKKYDTEEAESKKYALFIKKKLCVEMRGGVSFLHHEVVGIIRCPLLVLCSGIGRRIIRNGIDGKIVACVEFTPHSCNSAIRVWEICVDGLGGQAST